MRAEESRIFQSFRRVNAENSHPVSPVQLKIQCLFADLNGVVQITYRQTQTRVCKKESVSTFLSATALHQMQCSGQVLGICLSGSTCLLLPLNRFRFPSLKVNKERTQACHSGYDQVKRLGQNNHTMSNMRVPTLHYALTGFKKA